MKQTKNLIVMLLVVVMVCQLTVAVYATDIMPTYYNCNMCVPQFTISNGNATALVNYQGIEGEFTYIDFTVTIKKRTLGLFWVTVDIGYPNNEWAYSSTDIRSLVQERFPVESKGTYKAVFEIDFHGVSGRVDVIEEEIEFSYDGT